MSQSFSWVTSDNINIHGEHWAVEKPKAVIALVHGLGEHAGRYHHLAAYFNNKNIAVVGYDRRGHGKSGGKRGHTPSFDAFLDEIDQLLEKTKTLYPDVPTIMYGHSMGGNLVLNYLIHRKPTVLAAVATGPHIRLGFKPPAAMIAIGKLMRNIFPGFTQSNGLDVTQISRDVNVVETYKADSLVHDRLTAFTGMAMLEAGDFLDAYDNKIDTPLLLMHGEKDGITSAEGTRDFAGRVGDSATLKIWDGFYHEIHNEKEQLEVFDFTYDWMSGVLG